jgi:hypothetical protein
MRHPARESRFGHFRVLCAEGYRGHEVGTEFVAAIERNDARLGVVRGRLAFLGQVTPSLEPGTYSFPTGWLASPELPVHQGAERRPSRRKEQ